MISKIKKTYSRKKQKKSRKLVEDFTELVNDNTDTKSNIGLKQSNISDSRLYSLPSNYWKDSFDALLLDRTQLRQKNIIKKNIDASYNRKSYIENSQDKSNNDIFDKKLFSKNLIKSTAAMSTPLKNVKKNELICTISPIQENGKHKRFFQSKNPYVNKGKNNLVDFSDTLPSITIQLYDNSNKTDHESSRKLQLREKFKNLNIDKKGKRRKKFQKRKLPNLKKHVPVTMNKDKNFRSRSRSRRDEETKKDLNEENIVDNHFEEQNMINVNDDFMNVRNVNENILCSNSKKNEILNKFQKDKNMKIKVKEVIKLKRIKNKEQDVEKYKKRNIKNLKSVMVDEKLIRNILMKTENTINNSELSNAMNTISIEKLSQFSADKMHANYSEKQVNLSEICKSHLEQSKININHTIKMQKSLRVILLKNIFASKSNVSNFTKKCKVKLEKNSVEKYQRLFSLQKSKLKKKAVVKLKRLQNSKLIKTYLKSSVGKEQISNENFVKYIKMKNDYKIVNSNIDNFTFQTNEKYPIESIRQSATRRDLSESDFIETVSLITPEKCSPITRRKLRSLNILQEIDIIKKSAKIKENSKNNNYANSSSENDRISSQDKKQEENRIEKQLMENDKYNLRSSQKEKHNEIFKKKKPITRCSQSKYQTKLKSNLKSKQINKRKMTSNKKESKTSDIKHVNNSLPNCSKCNQCVHQLFNSITQYSENFTFLLLKENISENENRLHESTDNLSVLKDKNNSMSNMKQLSINNVFHNETSQHFEINEASQERTEILQKSKSFEIEKTNAFNNMTVLSENTINKRILRNSYGKNKNHSPGKENKNVEQNNFDLITRRSTRKCSKSTANLDKIEKCQSNVLNAPNSNHFNISKLISSREKRFTVQNTDSNSKNIKSIISNRSKSTEFLSSRKFSSRKTKLINAVDILPPLLHKDDSKEKQINNSSLVINTGRFLLAKRTTYITERRKNSKTVRINSNTAQNCNENEIDQPNLSAQNRLHLSHLYDVNFEKDLQVSIPIKMNNENEIVKKNSINIVLPSGKWRKSLNILRRNSTTCGAKLSMNRKTLFIPPVINPLMSVIDEENQTKLNESESTNIGLTKCDRRVQRKTTQRNSARNALKKISENYRVDKSAKNKGNDDFIIKNTEILFENSNHRQSSNNNSDIIERSILMRETIFGSKLLRKLSKSSTVSRKLRKSMNMKDIVLCLCEQSKPVEFLTEYSESALQDCNKIGEGVYGEVFMNRMKNINSENNEDVNVLKIIPIEGDIKINGESQKKFDEIVSELIIATALSSLRTDKDFTTSGFVEVKKIRCVKGKYPEHLVKLWELYDDNRGSENDHPDIFPENQLYIVMELANGGQDLEAFVFENALQSYSAFLQTVFTLAVAEAKFKFEHRDLHWGNILLMKTKEKEVKFRLNGKEFKIPTHGVKVTIIDYTLSRMMFDEYCFYNDLSNDNDLFSATGDYQFEIYRLMKKALNNEWTRFEPYTNILWLHYVVDKIISGVRYRYKKSEKHRSKIKTMMNLRDNLLAYKSTFDYVDQYLEDFIRNNKI